MIILWEGDIEGDGYLRICIELNKNNKKYSLAFFRKYVDRFNNVYYCEPNYGKDQELNIMARYCYNVALPNATFVGLHKAKENATIKKENQSDG